MAAPAQERWKRIEDIFQAALDLPQEQRGAYIARECGTDDALRREVETLLSQHDEAGDFIETPALIAAPLMSTLSLGEYDPSITEDSGDSLIGQVLGAYRVVAQIGQGGMGSVYRAVRDDGTFAQDVALKVVRFGMTTREVMDRFRRERQILAMLNHPNIARILDGGSTKDGHPYFVMELIEGQSILDHVRDHQFSLDQRLALFLEVCSAVSHAHKHLVIHRDLKPANILVTPEGQVKLLDFGVAKIFQPDFEDPAHTRANAGGLLTPAYASPEQVRGETVTTATDVYALGLILFELLTGTKAQVVKSSSQREIERAVCDTEPPRPSTLTTTLSGKLRGDLDNVILTAIQKDPSARYATVAQFAEDISRFRAGRPVSVRGASMFYRMRKFVARHKLVVGAASLVVLSLVGGFIGIAWQARIARENFNAIRKLANSLINEIDQAVASVPGTTKARHLILQRSLEYLDKLAQRSGSDAQLMIELADAYDTVGAIQGNRNRSNLGDYAGAMVSYRKSIEILRRLESMEHSPEALRRMALYSAEAARVYPNSPEALQLGTSSVATAEELARDKSDKNDLVVANTNFGLGYIYIGQEEPEKAIACFTKTRELGVALHRSTNNISVCDRYMATAYLWLDKDDEALRHLTAAIELDEARVKAKHTPRDLMDTSYDYVYMGMVLRRQGQFEEALEWERKAEKIRLDLAKADPIDQRPVIGLAETNEQIGALLGELGRPREGLPLVESVLRTREKFVAADPESSEDCFDLAHAQLEAAKLYRKIGMCAAADQVIAKAQVVFRDQRRKYSLKEISQIPECLPSR